MDNTENNSSNKKSSESLDDMMQHLEKAKQLEKPATRRTQRNSTGSGLQAVIQKRTDAAVLASNFPTRLEEIESNDAVTHRSSKRWKSAKVGVEAHGRLPIYYRMDGQVTHKGYISRIILDPKENTAAAEEFVEHISDTDTYSEHSDRLDTTTFIVTGGERLADPFPQSELRKLSGDGRVAENFSRQPAYVVQRPGDFPNFP